MSKLQIDIKPNKGYTKNIITISYDEKILFEKHDHGQPEDNSFYRDWAWVKDALLQAYELGRKDGRAELSQIMSEEKRKKLEAKGWMIGDAEDFLQYLSSNVVKVEENE